MISVTGNALFYRIPFLVNIAERCYEHAGDEARVQQGKYKECMLWGMQDAPDYEPAPCL
jgi:hypothetical protein